LARDGEGLTPCLSITIPDGLLEYWAYIDFKKPNGETFKTPRIDAIEGKLVYIIPLSVIDVDGKMEVQVVFQKADGVIWETYVKEFAVRYSINATDDIPDKEDFITEAQKTLDEANKTLDVIKQGGGAGYVIGDGLKYDSETSTISVDTTDVAEQDNTKPITSAGVFVEIGNINALLESI
jgi:hypothetical protein